MHLAGIVAAALAALTPGGPGAKGPAGFPRKAQGEWVAVAAEWAGKQVPAEVARRITVTVGPASLTVGPLAHDEGGFTNRGEPTEFAYRLDPAAKPAAIDLTYAADGAEHRQLGIYALDKGQLKLCWQHDGKGRPTEFKTVEAPTRLLLVLERPKK